MIRRDNYAIQVRQAREHLLSYDWEQLRRKHHSSAGEEDLFVSMLSASYRLSRQHGTVHRLTAGGWEETERFDEVMTLLDLVCDSREDRHICGRWKNMVSFGLQFHRELLAVDSVAEEFARDPEGFARACEALGGRRLPQGDVGYEIPFFEDLSVGIQLWLGDDEFPSQLKYMWDENALMYLRYETMHFARGLLLRRIREEMK